MPTPYRTPSPYSRSFGEYLKNVRTHVYGESLRQFGKRLSLSAGYIGKLEQGQIGVPRRATLAKMAERLGIQTDILLAKAGFTAQGNRVDHEFEYVGMKLRGLDPKLIPVVVDFIDVLVAKYPARTSDWTPEGETPPEDLC